MQSECFLRKQAAHRLWNPSTAIRDHYFAYNPDTYLTVAEVVFFGRKSQVAQQTHRNYEKLANLAQRQLVLCSIAGKAAIYKRTLCGNVGSVAMQALCSNARSAGVSMNRN